MGKLFRDFDLECLYGLEDFGFIMFKDIVDVLNVVVFYEFIGVGDKLNVE